VDKAEEEVGAGGKDVEEVTVEDADSSAEKEGGRTIVLE